MGCILHDGGAAQTTASCQSISPTRSGQRPEQGLGQPGLLPISPRAPFRHARTLFPALHILFRDSPSARKKSGIALFPCFFFPRNNSRPGAVVLLAAARTGLAD